jgi:hypothetical protein
MAQDQELDNAIRRLIDSGASDDDITFFIQNYKPTTPEAKPIETKPVEVKTEPKKKSFGDLPWYQRALAGGSYHPLDIAKRIFDPIIERNLEKITPQLAGEDPGVLNPNLEENPLLLKSWLPETEAEPGLFGTARHGIYENVIRPMASPLGLYSTFAVGNPAEYPPTPAPRGLEKVASQQKLLPPPSRRFEFVPSRFEAGESSLISGFPSEGAKLVPEQMIGLETVGSSTKRPTKVNIQTGEIIEPELTAPTGAGVPKFNSTRNPTSPEKIAKQKAASEKFGATQSEIENIVERGEVNPEKLVGFTKAEGKTPPSQSPKFKIQKGGVVVDKQTGERIGILARDRKEKPINTRDEILNFSRAVQSSYDLSFPFRQGLTLAHTSGWRNSWDDMVKALGSEDAYKAVMESIIEKPNHRRIKLPNGKELKSFSEEVGLDLVDLVSHREEQMYSRLAEKVPGVRASNRAYTAFANKLRADVFDNLIEQAEKQGLNPRKDLVLAKQIARYVNNASGRGSLGSLEKSAEALAGVFFSPKLIASRLHMINQILNPLTYRMTPWFVKKQYFKSMASVASTWMTFATLAKAGGAEVSLDPDSADFGKIKIGNTRLDPGGGFQQYLVLAHRMYSGKRTASTSGRITEFGSRFGAPTRLSAVEDFVVNKLAPLPAYAASFGGATRKRPFEVADETTRLVIPIIVQDIAEAFKEEDPTNSLLATIPAAVGMGVQTYGERGHSQRIIPEFILPREKDIRFKGGSFFD